jgi:hypothetical protein
MWIDSGSLYNILCVLDYFYRYMEILVSLEKQLKAILLNRVENP